MAAIDGYLAALTPAQREQFERVRRIVRSMVPDAEETISYPIPTSLLGVGIALAVFGGAKCTRRARGWRPEPHSQAARSFSAR